MDTHRGGKARSIVKDDGFDVHKIDPETFTYVHGKKGLQAAHDQAVKDGNPADAAHIAHHMERRHGGGDSHKHDPLGGY